MSYEGDLVDRELTLNRFNRLITEVMNGRINRTSFQAWEVEILLDMDACELQTRRRNDILRQYQRAVQRDLESGADVPMKLSQFLILRARK